MNVRDGMKKRIQRVLDGAVIPDDFGKLILFARDHADGRAAIREIGHFIAHTGARVIGSSRDMARDHWVIIRFFFTRTALKNNAFEKWNDDLSDAGNLPPFMPDFLRATFQRLGNKRIYDELGLKGPKAAKVLDSLIAKLAPTTKGTLTVTAQHTGTEFRLMNFLSSMLAVGDCLTDDQFIDEMLAVFASQGLLTKAEERELRQRSHLFSLYALSVIHGCEVEVEKGRRLPLCAMIGTDDIVVNVLVPITTESPPTRMAFPVLSINSRHLAKISPDLIERDLSETHLEISVDGILQEF
ncbi:hypothetical protein [Sinorhizobium meliloti]|uniref:hypothetical protein n=1 Tax=Rhizobium meliloti TaxID=382 RepID=UPI000A68AF1A|nr:hypothetical protein [Sinorhizobium meliloti]MDE3771035.1 hypothetical protein [Sinorhizobium meliloti]MDW9532187.1 hypothetical protein [Sinorhizobium meliloti]MDW9618420.1 hypothetical protein [Sinorhizobium meliloti]RVE77595.1 hypothetical protein CN240_29245 [Sinorhizobium meliloti]RVG41232.1 hypothetical protein CN227_29695 [Sinorhizobium meliloti]